MIMMFQNNFLNKDKFMLGIKLFMKDIKVVYKCYGNNYQKSMLIILL